MYLHYYRDIIFYLDKLDLIVFVLSILSSGLGLLGILASVGESSGAEHHLDLQEY